MSKSLKKLNKDFTDASQYGGLSEMLPNHNMSRYQDLTNLWKGIEL